ncbi:protein DOG1-like 4 [Typha angustifolia]|uniref:protein DOG1-like 4 n=1 Tax=Typha angustifolia TaxID=59011 RepID=UPI003C2CC916
MESFFENWVAQEEDLLASLLAVPRDRVDLHLPLISRALEHYHSYYLAKSRLADRDVFLVFSPSWLTPFERNFMWIAGVNPALIFQFVPADLSPEQRREVEELRREAEAVEREMTAVMARVQESVVSLLALEMLHGGLRNGEARAEAAAEVEDALRGILGEADGLRVRIVARIVEILESYQAVEFLANAANCHIRIRRWGIRQNGLREG